MDRWMRRTAPREPGTCWVWKGLRSPNGYGVFGQKVYAHRWTYAEMVGPIPRGMVIDHICRNRACVNPSHLRLATKRQNSLENSESPIAKNHKKESCPTCGGAYETRKNGWRFCRPCCNENWRNTYARIKGSHERSSRYREVKRLSAAKRRKQAKESHETQ